MKPFPSCSLAPFATVVAAFLLGFGWMLPSARAIPLTGANGRTVEFAGIKSAGPKGLLVQVKEGDAPFELGWEKLDLAKVQAQHPNIGAAYQKALGGETTELNLGIFAPAEPEKKMSPAESQEARDAKNGIFSATVRPEEGEEFTDARVVTLLPAGDPQGILLLSRGSRGASIPYLPRDRNDHPWAELQSRWNLAIVAANFTAEAPDPAADPPRPPSWVHADKGSGAALLRGIDELATKSGKDLSGLPIAIYGTDLLGAAFAFNFTQWKPDRVVATVAAKGAFYSASPTPESAKVPLIMIWGEYEVGKRASHTHAEVFGNHVQLKPNWIYAMEFRGAEGESYPSLKVAQTFLDQMLESRLGDGGLTDLDRSESWVGDLDTFEVGEIEDAEAVLPSTRTWLPGAKFAELWEQFANGKIPPPNAEPDPEP